MTERYLESRAALVTGGATGQGHAIALALAARGCDIAIGTRLSGEGRAVPGVHAHYPTQEEMARAVRAIEAQGVRATGADHDLRSNESCAALYQAAVDAFGKVDILCNAAGVHGEHPICGHDDELWHRIIDVNLNGCYRMTRLALPGMIERGWGRIVNIASTAGNIGEAINGAYCASKAGILGLTRCVALEGAPHGVTCNAINPGYVETGMMRAALGTQAERDGRNVDDLLAEIVASYPQKRTIPPGEIAALAAFLCRDDARGINMSDIDVAGGSIW